MKRIIVKSLLFALPSALNRAAARHPRVRVEMAKFDVRVMVGLKDGTAACHYVFKNGAVKHFRGGCRNPDAAITFKYVDTALKFLKPEPDYADIVHATKNFHVEFTGGSRILTWFSQLVKMIGGAGLEYGTATPDGCRRFTSNTNGGPIFVYVKDGKIVRTTPIELTDDDAPGWTIRARGGTFTPARKATVSPHALTMKSLVYSSKRILHPMIREDFDPDGARNPATRGISGYRRIGWDKALDIVAAEIKRMKRDYGPGAMALQPSSHHLWGNVGHYLSAMTRFGNLLGFTRIHQNPDSWEGWYWGAQHHYGNSLRVGLPGAYGTVEDCLKEAEMIVFWSSDPESTSGVYGGGEGSQRRLWAKELGIEFVHIDPNFTPTAQLLGGKWLPIRPGADPALAHAVMYVWITEDLYDQEYVAQRTTGFDRWRAYILGETDGVAKTPEWQEPETGVPARDVRALARRWGRRKVYLAAGGLGAGFGGACRTANGAQWARAMVLLMAMQGLGKPGVNFGNLQVGAPVDVAFYFPGYAEGGISGDLNFTAAAVNNYARMPHVPTVNPVKQMIPRRLLADAVIEGRASGHIWDGLSLEAQFTPFSYPAPGYSPIHMLYRYGGSSFGSIPDSGRLAAAYRHPSLECIVNQSIWLEGETPFADIILPACTMLERWDIGEWAGAGGYGLHLQYGLNHRMVVMQHKCIEPLGESRSDYDIFADLLHRFGLGAVFTEGCGELDWARRVFESSDAAGRVSWKRFVKKGYFVVPADNENARDPVEFRWFAEARPKDTPEPLPLPAQFADRFREGLQTASGKIEFVAGSLARGDGDNPERPALNRYIPSWEGPGAEDLFARYPLQLVTSHPRYSFHTCGDGKESAVNDLPDHRIPIDGHFYLLLRLNADDAKARGVGHRDLVHVFNDRGSVICVADVSQLMAPGVVKAGAASAEYIPVAHNGRTYDIGGCLNILTPSRSQTQGTDSMAPNSCLVQVEKWTVPPGETP